MSRGRLAAVAFLVLGLTLSPAGVSVATPATTSTTTATQDDPARPTINASINGDSVAADEFVVVRNGARLQLDVSMPAPNTTLDTVLVRVDGETVVDRTDAGDSVSINRSLPIGFGNNTISVVAEGSNDAVRSLEFRVYLETVPPALDLEAPVDTFRTAYQYPDLVVERTDVRFQGSFWDLTGFDRASFRFRVPLEQQAFRSFTVRGNGTFDERLLLSRGRNLVRLQTRDTLSNTYYDTFTIRVVDRDSPDLDLGFTDQQEAQPRYTVTGNVSDSVWVRNVTVRVFHYGAGPYDPNSTEYVALSDREYGERSGDRLSASFSQRVRLVEGTNLVVVQAHDDAGHRTARQFFIEYQPDRQLPPTISLITNQTVVRTNSTLGLTALVSDGDRDLTRILLEARNLDTGAVTDVESIRPAENTTFLLERAVNISSGVNQIDITAFDARGNSSARRFFVDTSQQFPLAEPPSGYQQVVEELSDEGDEQTGMTTVTPATPTPPPDTPASSATPATTTSTPTSPTPVTTTTGGTEPAGAGGGESDGSSDDADSDGDENGVDADDSGGGLLGGVPLLPVAVAVLVVLVGGGFLGYRELTKV